MWILGLGHAHPSTVITNKFLEELDTGTSCAWIEEKIGILERVSTLPLDYIRDTRNQDPRMAREVALGSPTDLGTTAAKMALERAGVTPKDIGMVICNSCNPDLTVPTEASRIAERLGVESLAYDVVTACPAFALHADYLANFREDHLPDFVLCVTTAALTQTVNYNDRTDGAIWGDAAAAWVVSPRVQGPLAIVDTHFQADPVRCAAVVVERHAHFHQDGRAVRDFSVRQTVRLIKRLEDQYHLDWNKDVFVGHQANRTMLEQITKNREIPGSNHWHNVSYLGNQAAAGAPATISQNWDRLKAGTRLTVAVVGAGLSWGSVLMEVQEK